MNKPLPPSCPISLAKSYFPEEDINLFLSEAPHILRGKLSMGSWVEKFQASAAKAHGCSYAVATNSCTSALEVALLSSGVRPGDDVIVPVQTFIATGMAVHNIGARPIFCDINPETLCLDFSEMIQKATERVKAVIVVHFGGLITPEFSKIQTVCRERGWMLIEDAAHAHGAAYEGRPSGSLGDAGCFSYYPTKILTSGEGGMLVTNDKQLADNALSYQYRGQDFSLKGEVFTKAFGRNIRLPELSALLGVLQYARLKEYTDNRRKVAAVYDAALKGHSTIRRQVSPEECLHAYWLYVIVLPSDVDREELKRRCKNNWDIVIDWSYYPPLHLMPAFQNLYGTRSGTLPVAEDLLKRVVCLPIHPTISEEDARAVASCFLYEFEEMERKEPR